MTLPGLVAANNLSDVVDRERAWDNLGSSVSADFPISPPSLDLDFATNKSLIDNVSGNNLITFSRASTGTFVGSNGLIQTAASGVPRFDHNPETGESLGLLVEEARTNLVLYSEQFDNAGWTKSNVTVTANAAVAPDGASTADKIVANTGATSWYSLQVLGSSPSTSSCFVYAKAAGWNYVSVGRGFVFGNGDYAIFDLQTGVISRAPTYSGSTASIVSVGNGWYRCTLLSPQTDNNFHVTPQGVGASINGGTPNSTNGVHVWGAQLEADAFPTSYIPTTTATVTRAADVASITGTNFSSWYNQSQGTFIATTPSGIALTASANQTYFGTSTGTINANLGTGDGIKYGNGSPPSSTRFFVVASSATQADSNSAINASKIALAYAINNFAMVRGGSVVTDSSGNVPTGMDTFTICGQGSQSYSRMTYYPVRLADLALQYITSASGSPSSTTYPYTFTVKGKDTLALNSVSNASTRDFVFIKGLSTSAQPRLTTAAQQVASGTVFQDAAMLKASPTTSGNYLFSSGITLSGVSTRINGTPALSIATSPFSGSTATASILLRELQPQTNWRITEPMPSGTIASPEFAIPFETNDFVLFMKAGQN
jgi:hypothetical protein